MKERLPISPGMDLVYLKVAEGGLYLAPTMVQTVLGSCLGGVFHVPSRGIGAFFHAFLPRREDYEPDPKVGTYKFVDMAMEHTMAQFARMGVKPQFIRVSLIGGSNGLVDERSGVGARNVEAALASLERFRLRLFFKDTGGAKGRKVFFNSQTGEIKIVPLNGITGQGGPYGVRRAGGDG